MRGCLCVRARAVLRARPFEGRTLVELAPPIGRYELLDVEEPPHLLPPPLLLHKQPSTMSATSGTGAACSAGGVSGGRARFFWLVFRSYAFDSTSSEELEAEESDGVPEGRGDTFLSRFFRGIARGSCAL